MRSPALLRLVPVLLLAGCAASSSQQVPVTNQPLVGRIWDVAQGRWLDEPTLRSELAKARFVLLGEQHDNAGHHQLQALLVGALAAKGHKPALAFEMLDVDQQGAVDAALAREPGNPDAVSQAVDWAHSGWPDWSLYRPIFAAGLEQGLPIVAANLPKAQGRALGFQGTSALPPELVSRLGLDTPLPEDVSKAMRAELFQAHCGYMPEEAMEPMVQVQRARDSQMAERLAASDKGGGAILIAGAGHARTDRGVPAQLARRVPGAQVRSVAFVEVDASKPRPEDYVDSPGSGKLPFDYVWFTPAAQREDLCEKLRKRMEHGSTPPPKT